jgi:enterochelin esterase-like enzyme
MRSSCGYEASLAMNSLTTKTSLCALALAAATATAATPLPEVANGRIERLENFASRHVEPRHIDVWLPDGYSADKRYNVLYVHDGQMLFDARTTWNKQAWNLAPTITRLVREGRIPDTLVVGIWNNAPLRYAEYYPDKWLALAPAALDREYTDKAQRGRPLADAYLRFLVEELKPAIDRRYATRPGPEGTYVMGSSMGGLISWYALCEYPQVFGGAAGLSTHWVGIPTHWGPERLRNAALPLAAFNYLQRQLPAPGAHRLYTDRGSIELELQYAPAQTFIGELLRDRGYGSAQATTRVFEGTRHSESDWAARVEVPLVFLMGARPTN